jgi:Na+-transporting NADH:ubiquinone oxidoreductase subunit NqrC
MSVQFKRLLALIIFLCGLTGFVMYKMGVIISPWQKDSAVLGKQNVITNNSSLPSFQSSKAAIIDNQKVLSTSKSIILVEQKLPELKESSQNTVKTDE